MVLHYASKLHWKQLAPDSVKSKCLSLQTMISNGLISNSGKGLFTVLPLGQRIVDKLSRIVDNEFEAIGAQKMEVPSLAPKKIWSDSGRWDSMGQEMFKVNDRLDIEYCLQPTAEEMFTMSVAALGLVKEKTLPLMLYQTSNKYRDEMNPRFGLLRSRQFLMNDLYSFDVDKKSAESTYEVMTEVYRKLFEDILELKHYVRRVEADSGAMGGDVSHEFHLPNPSAEDSLLICKKCKTAKKKDEHSGSFECAKCNSNFEKLDTVEVGHTFQLGEKYSRIFHALSPKQNPYFMCCFGLGLTRIIAASIDAITVSNKAMRIPKVLSPFQLCVVFPKDKTENAMFLNSFLKDLDEVEGLKNQILIDDRVEKSIGRRINEMNQLGIPNIVVASGKKYVDPFEIQKIEYFVTKPSDDKVLKVGDLTHSELFRTLENAR